MNRTDLLVAFGAMAAAAGLVILGPGPAPGDPGPLDPVDTSWTDMLAPATRIPPTPACTYLGHALGWYPPAPACPIVLR